MNSYVFIHMLRIFMCYTSATIFVYILGQVDVRRARQQLKAFHDQQYLTQLLYTTYLLYINVTIILLFFVLNYHYYVICFATYDVSY